MLVDSRPVVERTWHRWAARHDIHDPGLVRRAHGRRSVETVRAVAPHLDPAPEVRWLAEAELSDVEGLAAIQGASLLLAALSEGEWAVVTSGGRELALLRLEHVGLPVPRVLLAAEDVDEGKPSPAGYLLAARQLGFAPTECVVIEDTPAGIEAGRAAGAKVLAVCTTFPDADLGEADAVVETPAVVRIDRGDGWLRLNLGT